MAKSLSQKRMQVQRIVKLANELAKRSDSPSSNYDAWRRGIQRAATATRAEEKYGKPTALDYHNTGTPVPFTGFKQSGKGRLYKGSQNANIAAKATGGNG